MLISDYSHTAFHVECVPPGCRSLISGMVQAAVGQPEPYGGVSYPSFQSISRPWQNLVAPALCGG